MITSCPVTISTDQLVENLKIKLISFSWNDSFGRGTTPEIEWECTDDYIDVDVDLEDFVPLDDYQEVHDDLVTVRAELKELEAKYLELEVKYNDTMTTTSALITEMKAELKSTRKHWYSIW